MGYAGHGVNQLLNNLTVHNKLQDQQVKFLIRIFYQKKRVIFKY